MKAPRGRRGDIYVPTAFSSSDIHSPRLIKSVKKKKKRRCFYSLDAAEINAVFANENHNLYVIRPPAALAYIA